jgi:branched-chain amino acid transport system ATP-binding protein
MISAPMLANDIAASARPALMRVRGLHAFYGKSHIIQGVDLDVGAGEIVSVLGRNGVGRSTMLKAIMGDVDVRGSVAFDGREIVGLQPYEIARRGLGYVPENREVFAALTVRENLVMGERRGHVAAGWTIEQMFELFPKLAERAEAPAGVLSGGEQQMLTICRTLMGNPGLIMIDEPTEGLAPMMVELVGNLIHTIARRGTAVLLVEQKLTIALRVSRRLYVMGHGRIVFEGSPQQLEANSAVRQEWLEV